MEASPRGERLGTSPLEVFEKEDEFVVRAELPGMKEEDIDVSVSAKKKEKARK